MRGEEKFPKRGQLVLAVVKEVRPYGAICRLPEYSSMEAFLPFSEVASRWIKNIHEHIHQGQKVIAKVIRSEPARHVVDISLKRVNEKERRAKLQELEERRKVRRIVEAALKKARSRMKPERVLEALREISGNPYEALLRIRDEPELLPKNLPPKVSQALREIAASLGKARTLQLRLLLEVSTTHPRGVEEIRRRLLDPPEGVKVHYLAAPKYLVLGTGEDEEEIRERIRQLLRRFSHFPGEVRWEWEED